MTVCSLVVIGSGGMSAEIAYFTKSRNTPMLISSLEIINVKFAYIVIKMYLKYQK